MVARLEKIEKAIVPDEYGDASWLYQDDLGFEDRRKAYEAGEFGLVGVQAIAEILIPHGSDYIVQTLTSPGLWGIESDSDDSYFDEVFEQEKETLIDILKELHVKITS